MRHIVTRRYLGADSSTHRLTYGQSTKDGVGAIASKRLTVKIINIMSIIILIILRTILMTMPLRSASTFMVRSVPSEPAIPIRRITMPLARRFHQICVAMVSGSLAEADLTPLQYGVLAYLNRDDGEPGIDQIGLAARLGIDRNNASVIVGELEKRELVERRILGGDRRGRHVYLTSQGEKLYRRLLPSNAAANDRILAPLKPRERELLRDLLVRVIQGNAVYARPGAGRRKRGSRQSQPG